MSGWNEDNFLEEVTPLLRQERRGQASARRCPDAETLGAVLDGESSDVLRDAVTAHVAKCPACAGLQRRLVAFGERGGEAGGGEADWQRTEQRLQNRMEGWLAQEQPARLERRPTWRWMWALACAAGLVLAAGLVMMGRGRWGRPAEVAAIRPVAAPPTQMQLDAGTRMWVLVKSLHGQSDQSFEFDAVVLLPVTDGSIVLDQETEVYGTGRVKQGRPSVSINQIGLHGQRYRLTSRADATGDPAKGSGGSVQFDAGQVVEMWLGATATYQKVAGETGQP